MLVTNQQSAELAQPSVGALHDPAPLVTPHLASIVIAPVLVVFPVRCQQLDGALLQSLAQRIGVIASIGNDPRRLLPRPATRTGDSDFRQRGFRKRNFCRRGTFEPNSQRKTLTVDQYHPLCALATLGFSDGGAPFLAGAKLPSKKVSSHFSRPSSSKAPNKARQASSQTPSSCHCFSRRQHVAGEGNSLGRKRQAAPVCRIHRMPSKQARFEAHGRPRLSRRRRGAGNISSTSCHCSSLNSFCRFFMAEFHQLTRLTISTRSEAEPIYETRSNILPLGGRRAFLSQRRSNLRYRGRQAARTGSFHKIFSTAIDFQEIDTKG